MFFTVRLRAEVHSREADEGTKRFFSVSNAGWEPPFAIPAQPLEPFFVVGVHCRAGVQRKVFCHGLSASTVMRMSYLERKLGLKLTTKNDVCRTAGRRHVSQ